MSPETNPDSISPRSPDTKRPTSSTSVMLTPSEIESLRQHGKETIAFARKAFKKDRDMLVDTPGDKDRPFSRQAHDLADPFRLRCSHHASISR
jgi:hypothetical protein